ncbi:MAG: dicarboxylate/amino acid:cation symporter [Vulcanimicrobiota bacterium]
MEEKTEPIRKIWYRQLHWQIITAMILGIIYGFASSMLGWQDFTREWIKPWGVIFINLLKFIAIPMILVSLILGISSLKDLTRLSKIGGKTIGLYLITTILAVTIGLFLANFLKPGTSMPPEMRKKMADTYAGKLQESQDVVKQRKEAGPLKPLVDMVPDNFFKSASDNTNMLSMVFIAIILGIALVKTPAEKTDTIKQLLENGNELILTVVNMIMKIAPLGVFAQLSTVITDIGGKDLQGTLQLLESLGYYVLVVLLGLLIQTLGIYSGMVRLFTPVSFGKFFRSIRSMQLIGFSTSSSAATLPVTMESCEKNLGISEEITGFTLPVGATINMDGTSLYQAISVIFIAQVFNMNLTFWDQLTIILTTTLSSIGTAGVPGAGVVMLVIVLQSINVPIGGIALILGVERIIDMFRTVTNITGDAAVTTLIATTENRIEIPEGETV